MPFPAATPSPYQSMNDRKPFLKGKKRKLLTLIGALVIAVALAYITTKGKLQNLNPFNKPGENTQEIINKDTNEFTDKAINNIKTTTIEDIKEASESTGINPLESPSLSDTEIQKKIYENLGNKEPENHQLSYSDYGLSIPVMEIKQGDLVTWSNDGTDTMSIAGDGWQSATPRQPGDGFTYTFLFLGEYKYKANDKFEGTIVVTQ